MRLTGKWNKQTYQLVRKLGSGATGTVYLANSARGQVAIKLAENNMAIASEVNVLKHFSKVQGQVLGPSLLDVDDMVTITGTYPFYVMEYLKGTELIYYMQKRGPEWVGILIVQLLDDLKRLHQAGWVFGDLKPDNLLVVGPPARIRWIDVGGTTMMGRSIKEYTEFFDRGYWGLGTRKAEPAYDLFAIVMVMINCYYPRRFEKQMDKPILQLKKAIYSKEALYPYREVMVKALQSKFEDAEAMRKAMIQAMSRGVSGHSFPEKKTPRPLRHQVKKRKGKKTSNLVEIFLFISFLLLVYILYLFGQMM
ncbi:protein kinase domain-containing protein [Halalkalibacterium ligniniphilum]|uniref:protein kinase domain-containing protein n=1 Tax=Halalkalibacterium ligniniphilum TaxID=1134413 RepID=UPI00034799F8|nr:protein kinase [Halalkalibacterium ligniniphilum]